MVFLNGAILGIHRRPRRLVAAFRQLRRAGRVGEFVSITLAADAVYIASDGGRVCRPLIICAGGVPSVTAAHIAKARQLSPCCFPLQDPAYMLHACLRICHAGCSSAGCLAQMHVQQVLTLRQSTVLSLLILAGPQFSRLLLRCGNCYGSGPLCPDHGMLVCPSRQRREE